MTEETNPENNYLTEDDIHIDRIVAFTLDEDKTLLQISDQSEGFYFQYMTKSQVKELIASLESIYKQMKE